ncbi:MAG: class I SAM-dependent methyltransferase [Candidatus Shapirobacteria bacterium]|jgi:SAM-dependent methyltransferase
MLDYQKRFNKIYRYSYDIPSWSCYPISEDIVGFVKTLLSKGVLKKNSSILDVGCGRGRLLVKLEKLGFTNTTGVDISSVAVKYAKNQNRNSTIFKADIVKGLPIPGNTFDLIMDLTMTSSCRPRLWPKIYQEFNRLLKNDGHIILEMFIRPPNTLLSCPLTKKSEKIPDRLDQIFGITNEDVDHIIGRFFTIIKARKSYPDSLGRYYILAKKTK